MKEKQLALSNIADSTHNSHKQLGQTVGWPNRTSQNGKATTIYIHPHSPTAPCKETTKIIKREIPAGTYKMVTL